MRHSIVCISVVLSSFFSIKGQNKTSQSPKYFYISDVSASWTDSSMAKKYFGKKSLLPEIKKLIPQSYQVEDSHKFNIQIEFIEARFLEKGKGPIIDCDLSIRIRLNYLTEKGIEKFNDLDYSSNGQMLVSNRSKELQKYWKKCVDGTLEKLDKYLDESKDKIILPFQAAILDVDYNVASLDNTDSLGYSKSRVLNYDDFKGKPDALSRAVGATYCGYGVDYDAEVKNFQLYIHLKAACIFHKDQSWVLPIAKKLPKVLQHEQLHFDICYWQMLELVKLIKQDHFSADSLKPKLQKLYKDSQTNYRQQQDLYDEETKHGTEEKEQAKWTKLVGEKLKSLEN
jgi:hypothetical protein